MSDVKPIITDMDNQINAAILFLIEKAKETTYSNKTVDYSQAALNIAMILAVKNTSLFGANG